MRRAHGIVTFLGCRQSTDSGWRDEMAEDHGRREQAAQAVNDAESRRAQQDESDPSGHGMQVTPRQQQHIAETSSDPPEAAHIDEDILEDLKGDHTG
jgi:hypothetical protein